MIEKEELDINKSKDCGINAAKKIFNKGGKELINKIKNELDQ